MEFTFTTKVRSLKPQPVWWWHILQLKSSLKQNLHSLEGWQCAENTHMYHPPCWCSVLTDLLIFQQVDTLILGKMSADCWLWGPPILRWAQAVILPQTKPILPNSSDFHVKHVTFREPASHKPFDGVDMSESGRPPSLKCQTTVWC